jgi:hypothetical protein
MRITNDVIISKISGQVCLVVKGKGWTNINKVQWGDKIKVVKINYPKGVLNPPVTTTRWVDASSRLSE